MLSGSSNIAAKVDIAFLYVVGICVVLLALVTFCMVFFVIRYGRERHPHAEQIEGSLPLEIIWTVLPTILVLVMFYFGWSNFSYIRNAPKDAMPVKVTGVMWEWEFEYKNGKHSDVLKVPLGRPVKLVITSKDVIHSFYIPAFRVKEDAVPGMNTHMWFNANELGSYDIFCTEYCGTGHSHMISKLVVMPAEEFDKWYATVATPEEEDRGMKLLRDKGCLGCHSTDGAKKIGPTFKGIFRRKEVVITGGKEREIVVDEDYCRKSVLEPAADIVKGYPPVMPVIKVNKEELDSIIITLKELK